MSLRPGTTKVENGRTYRLNDNHRWERVESTQVAPSTPGVHHTETPEFKAWFGDSKVVDADGKPKVVFHGAKRADRVGNRFRKDRATSGPMQYFTDDPEIASNYSVSKNDTSSERPTDYAQWFKWTPPGQRRSVDIDKAWFYLPYEERDRIKNALYTVGYSDYEEASGPIIAGSESIMPRDSIDWELRQARGNALRAAVEIWLSSGTLFNEESRFLEVLGALGVKGADIDDPDEARSGVFPVYLDIRNPLDVANIPDEVYQALEQSSKRKRAKKAAGGDPDAWDKNTISGPDWIASLMEDRKQGSAHAWTRVPDWATETLEEMGYDGIKDKGGKNGGREHEVWVPFREDQIKSKANRGTWDRSTGNMLMSLRPGTTKVEDGKTYRLNEHHRWERQYNFDVNQTSSRPQNKVVSGLQADPAAISHYRQTDRAIGVSAQPRKLSETVITGIVSHANTGNVVFVDSGIASTVSKGQGVEFDRVFDNYFNILNRVQPSHRNKVWVVAPDHLEKIGDGAFRGDQQKTLDLQREHAETIAEFQNLGATVIVPIQKGKNSLTAAAADATDVIDFSNGRTAFGIPYNKGAWDDESILDLAMNQLGAEAHFHLLGAGKEKVDRLAAKIHEINPDIKVTGDAATEARNAQWKQNRKSAYRQILLFSVARKPSTGNILMALRMSGLSGRAITELGNPDASTVANPQFEAARWIREEARNTLKFWDEFREFRDKDLAREYRKMLGPKVQRLSLYDPDDEDDEEEEDDSEVMSRAEMIAEFLTELYGEDAEKMFDELFSGAITMAVRWDPFQHPRDKAGRFIEKNSPEAVTAARSKIEDALVGGRGHATMRTLVDHLAILTSKQLADLKADYNIKAGAKDKQALVEKIADRLDRGRRKPQPESEAADIHEFNALVDKMLVRHFSPTLVRKIESKENYLSPGEVTPLDGQKFFTHIRELARDAGEIDAFYTFANEAGELFTRQGLEVPDGTYREVVWNDSQHFKDKNTLLKLARNDSLFQQMERENAMRRKKEIDAYHWAVEHAKSPTKHDPKVGIKPEKMEYDQFMFWKAITLEGKYRKAIKTAERFLERIGSSENLHEHIAFYKKHKSAIDTIVRAGGPGRMGWKSNWLRDGIDAANWALKRIDENPIDAPGTRPSERLHAAFEATLLDEWALEHELAVQKYVESERDKATGAALTTEQVRRYRYRSWLPARYNDTKTTLDYIENREKYMASGSHANALKMLERGIAKAKPRLDELYAKTIYKDDWIGKYERKKSQFREQFTHFTSKIIALVNRRKEIQASGTRDQATLLELEAIEVLLRNLREEAERADRAIADHEIESRNAFMDALFPSPEPGKSMVDVPYEKAFEGAEIPVDLADMVNFGSRVLVAKNFLNRLFAGREKPIVAQVKTTRDEYLQKPSFYPERASARNDTIYVYPQVRIETLIHEVGHVLESENDAAIAVLAKAFAQQAIEDSGQKVDRLPRGSVTAGMYDPQEIGAQAIFGHPYDSKYYPQTASEVTSRGLEYLWSDPITFLREHPDHFDFTVAAIKGMFK